MALISKKHADKYMRAAVVICWMSFLLALLLRWLPSEEREGSFVPDLLKNTPTSFRNLVLALNFSFFASISTISLCEKYPKAATYSFAFALASWATVIAILIWLIILPVSLKLGARLSVMRCLESFLPTS